MERENMWCIFRDGKLYEAHLHKYRARHAFLTYRPGSKHEWTMERYDIQISLPK